MGSVSNRRPFCRPLRVGNAVAVSATALRRAGCGVIPTAHARGRRTFRASTPGAAASLSSSCNKPLGKIVVLVLSQQILPSEPRRRSRVGASFLWGKPPPFGRAAGLIGVRRPGLCGLSLDPSSLSILLGCFGRRSSSKGCTTPVENRRLVSVPPKEKLFGPCPVNPRCSNVGHA